jgi:glycosyltransferase involved in cell wall biosynthesis
MPQRNRLRKNSVGGIILTWGFCKMKLSLILPIYNEQLILEEVLDKYIADLENIRAKKNTLWEIIAVDDGSGDATPTILLKYSKQYRNFKTVTLNGRYGKQSAITAGFAAATGDAVMIADIDLLNPAGVLARVFNEYDDGRNPIVHGYREFIGHEKREAVLSDFWTRVATKLFWISGRYNGKINVALYSGDVADIIRDNPTKNKYMRTMNNWVGIEPKELWFISEYNKEELKQKTKELKNRQNEFAPVIMPRDRGREHTASRIYALVFAALAVISFVFALATIHTTVLTYSFIMVSLGVVLWFISIMFFLKSMLLKRVGAVRYKEGETLYEISGIRNK